MLNLRFSACRLYTRIKIRDWNEPFWLYRVCEVWVRTDSLQSCWASGSKQANSSCSLHCWALKAQNTRDVKEMLPLVSPCVGDLRGPQVNVVLDFRMERVFSLPTVWNTGVAGELGCLMWLDKEWSVVGIVAHGTAQFCFSVVLKRNPATIKVLVVMLEELKDQVKHRTWQFAYHIAKSWV